MEAKNSDFPAYRVVRIGDLIPYVRNARLHSEEQIAQLAASIREFGFTNPILIDGERGVIAGHGRLLAARQLGLAEVPVVELSHLTLAQRRAYAIADNRLGLSANWDEEMLRLEISDLKQAGLDVALTGFEDLEIDQLFASDVQRRRIVEEDGFDLETTIKEEHEPLTQKGDVWTLGRHRLMCGDCRSKSDVATLLAGKRPELLITDPPYCSGGFQEAGRYDGSIGTDAKIMPRIANDTLSTRGYCSLIKTMIEQQPALVSYIFIDWRMWAVLFDVMEASGFGVRNMIVWNKKSPGMGHGWRAQHELIMFALKTTPNFDGHRGYGNVIECSRTGNELHPTQKPVEIIAQLLDNTDWTRGVVDPFGGSGTTLISCEQLERESFTMEIDPMFCDVTIRRWEKITNGKAEKA